MCGCCVAVFVLWSFNMRLFCGRLQIKILVIVFDQLNYVLGNVLTMNSIFRVFLGLAFPVIQNFDKVIRHCRNRRE